MEDAGKVSGWVTTRDWSRYDFGGDSIVERPDLPAAEVTAFRARAFRGFYLRPSRVLAELKTLAGWAGIRRAIQFLRWM